MSKPCYARRLEEGERYANPDRAAADGALDHEPLMESWGSHPVLAPLQPIRNTNGAPFYPLIEGEPHALVICRHCHALVMVPLTELPK